MKAVYTFNELRAISTLSVLVAGSFLPEAAAELENEDIIVLMIRDSGKPSMQGLSVCLETQTVTLEVPEGLVIEMCNAMNKHAGTIRAVGDMIVAALNLFKSMTKSLTVDFAEIAGRYLK